MIALIHLVLGVSAQAVGSPCAMQSECMSELFCIAGECQIDPTLASILVARASATPSPPLFPESTAAATAASARVPSATIMPAPVPSSTRSAVATATSLTNDASSIGAGLVWAALLL